MITGKYTRRSEARNDGSARTSKLRQSRISGKEAETTNILWGEEPPEITQSCRFLFQNVNGISRFNDFGDAHEIGKAAEEIGVNILGLAETNLD